jgi:hypothetical protein
VRKHEIRVGGLYEARVNGKYTTVRVDSIGLGGMGARQATTYQVTNLATGRQTIFHSAAKFRCEVKATAQMVNSAKVMDDPADDDNDGEDSDDSAGKDEEARAETYNDHMRAAELAAEHERENQYPENERKEGEQHPDPTNSAPTVEPTSCSVSPIAEDAHDTTPSMTGGLAAKIAASRKRAASGVTLTPEQQDGIDTALLIQAMQHDDQRVMVFCAGAGCGKTFELTQLESRLTGRGQYTAFNASLCNESKVKFKVAAVNTTHSLAHRAVGRRYQHRLNGKRMMSHEIARRLGIKDQNVPGEPYPSGSHEWYEAYKVAGYSDGNPPPPDFAPCPLKRLKASWLAGQLTEAIRRFCQSADREINGHHFKWMDIDSPGKRTNNERMREYLLPFAQRMWADIVDEQGTMPFNHDNYVKIWQLGEGDDRPVIAADYILLDEYQDTAPVFLDVLMQQTHAMLILVGDDNQRIYEWRGAVNAGDYFPNATRRLLSQSFRFGQIVADVANSVLSTLEEPTDLVMKGCPDIPSRITKLEEARCYLYRTNAGAVGKLMRAMAEGKRGHLIGGSKEMLSFCRAALQLQRGEGTSHPDLGCFTTWAEVQEYSKEDEGQDLRLLVKLIDEFTADKIIEALDMMPSEADADLILSTAHRSKGREWSSVKLGPDFPLPNKMTDADRRLLYVACTRAQEELDISECPTFCGGIDRSDGDVDNTGRGVTGKHIPGLEITYTVPMPTEEQLAEYRERKGARVDKPAPPVECPTAPVASPAPDATPLAPSPSSPAPATVPARQPVVGFTWARDGERWCVRGPADSPLGSMVTVTSRAGVAKQVRLLSVVKRWNDSWVYEV